MGERDDDDRASGAPPVGVKPPADATWEPAATVDTIDIKPEAAARPRSRIGDRLPPGATVGRYQILDALGEGGMGVVYAAYDPQLGRKVAIKLLTPSPSRDEAHHARLLREAQALAQLSHPNVVAVHDVGDFNGRVFLAMDLIDGRNVRQWLASQPRPWRQVRRVFVEAARGLVAAHRAGLVHRDLKPDNLLVGRDARVFVSDFGAARQSKEFTAADETARPSTDATQRPTALTSQLTQAGRIIGTPMYMPPEAFDDGNIEQAGDQFSFCVTMYEALYGRLPFDLEADGDARWRVREPPPRSQVPSWLRRVVVRGLARTPADRHPSMAALLHALEHDPTTVRVRTAVVLAAILIVGITVGVVHRAATARAGLCRGAEGELAGVWDATVKSRMRADFVATGAPAAADVWARTERVIDAYAGSWVAMRGETCSATRIAGVQPDSVMALRMGCLDNRLVRLKAFVEVFGHPDAEVIERAVKAAHGLPAVSACADVATLKMPTPLPEDPEARRKIEALRRQLEKSEALASAGQYREAANMAGIGARAAADVHYRPVEAELLLRWARSQTDLGQVGESEKTFQRAIAAAVAGGDEEVAASAASLLAGVVGYDLGRADWGAWVELARAHIEHMGGNAKAEAQLENELGLCYGASDLDEAARHFTRALALREKTMGRDSPAVAMAHNNLGSNALQRGDYEVAVRELQTSADIYERVLGPQHPDLAYALSNLGDTLLEKGESEQARPYFMRVRGILGPANAHPSLWVENEESLCEIELAEGHWAAVLDCLQPIRAVVERGGAAGHPRYRANLSELEGDALSHLGRHDAAVAAHRRALALRETSSTRPAMLAAARVSLAGTLLAAGQRAESLRLLKEAAALSRKDGDKEAPDAVETLGRWHLVGRDPAEALRLFEHALALRRAKRAQPPTDMARTLIGIAEAQLALGHGREATESATAALAFSPRLPEYLVEEARNLIARTRDGSVSR